jgi:hypothetical protein
MEAAVREALHELSVEVHELSLTSEVDRLDGPPDPLEFYRKYVAPNVPCIFTSTKTSNPFATLILDASARECCVSCCLVGFFPVSRSFE